MVYLSRRFGDGLALVERLGSWAVPEPRPCARPRLREFKVMTVVPFIVAQRPVIGDCGSETNGHVLTIATVVCWQDNLSASVRASATNPSLATRSTQERANVTPVGQG